MMPESTSKYKPEFDNMAYVACVDGGFTDGKLAKLFSVTETTINNWKHSHPSFFESLKRGKDEFDIAVAEDSLLKRVTGYRYEEETREYKSTGDDKGGLQLTKVVTKDIAPDPTSIIFFLKNRNPERWRDARHLEHGGNLKISHEDALKELDE